MRRPLKPLIALMCLTASFAPTTGSAQPGRTFTPPPPPPPTFTPPPRIPTLTPPPTFTPPPTINNNFQNQIQQMQQSNQSNQQMNRMQQQYQSDRSVQQSTLQQMQLTRDRVSQDMDASRRLTHQSSSAGRTATGGGGAAKAPKKAVVVDVVAVTVVEPNTQSARLGLLKGDVLLSYAGTALADPQHLQNLIALQPEGGDPVELVVARNDAVFTVNVAPGRLGVRMRMQKMELR
jgi:C-terminal processing protease CtpA/Prc